MSFIVVIVEECILFINYECLSQMRYEDLNIIKPNI